MDLTGSWLGTYWQYEEPTRFEATFVQSGSALSGRILDDGYLGDAEIVGQVIGRGVRFTKRYFHADFMIRYTGTLSEEGHRIQGDWFISPQEVGTWEAYRSESSLDQSFQTILKQQSALRVENTVKALASKHPEASGWGSDLGEPITPASSTSLKMP